jgi:hypothetical protein
MACPECGRLTSEAEQAHLARLRVMPRSLGTIAQVGMVFTIVVWWWSAAGILIAVQSASGRAGSSTLEACAASIGACTAALPVCWWVRRRLPGIHRRNEAWAWIAAHATWIGPLAAVAIMRLF